MNKRYTIKKLEKYYAQQNIEKIVLFLHLGNYKVRRQSAIYLGEIKDYGTISELESHIDDPVGVVRESVAEAILKMDNSQEMQHKIAEVQLKIDELKAKKKEFGKGKHSDPINFRAKQEWANVLREMLKKPMRR